MPLREQKGKPELEKESAAHVTNKGLVCRTYIELLKSVRKREIIQSKMGKGLPWWRSG